MSRFDSFVLFAEMRTGSNFLETSLNTVPGLACHGEAFNLNFVGYPNRDELFGMTLPMREARPADLLARIRAAEGMNGFRYFHDHDPRVLDLVLSDPRCAKIVLTRNPLDSYLSLKIARQTGQWKLGDARHRKTAKATFDAVEFAEHLRAAQDFQMKILRGLQVSGQTAYYIGYDDIGDLEILNGLLRFLGLTGTEAALSGALVRQNPTDLEEKVANYDQMCGALAQMDRFDLARTPNFEPRRGPAVPGFVAASGAPLIYMPVQGGPVEAVCAWLASLGPEGEAGLLGDFTQKALKQWKRNRPGHRSFTVVRHPVARAHAAFCEVVLAPANAELRAQMRRGGAVALPDEERTASMDLDAHRAAFASFAGFLKSNLAAQTSVRIHPAWASQTAVVSAFAQVGLPDMILREETLAADTEMLCRSAGVTGAPPFTWPGETTRFPLAEVYDPRIEAAIREVYARDYAGFGYSGWTA